jgi:predicted CXXCH cytochrome family protein
MSVKKPIHKTTCLQAKREGGKKSMKRFIVLAVFALALTLLLSGTAMAYTDYIPYLSKGTTGAVATDNGILDDNSVHTDDFGVGQNEAPAGMPNSYDAYALGCFWCHGFEKRMAPNNTDVVDLTRVLTAPNVDPLVDAYLTTNGLPADTELVVDPLARGDATLSESDTAGIGEITVGNLLASGSGLPVSGSRWTNAAKQIGQPYGPHGGYSNTTDICKVCHDVHAAAGSKRLTAGQTAEDICETCHDFTEGISIYGAIEASTGNPPDGGHRVQGLWDADETTDTVATPSDGRVPGYDTADYLINGGPNDGSFNTSGTLIPGYMPGTANQVVGSEQLDYPQTGGVYTYTSASLASRESQLTCTDCHTPHGNTSMRPFKGDRTRLGSSIIGAVICIQPTHITWLDIPAGTETANGMVNPLADSSVAQLVYDLATGSNGATADAALNAAVGACGASDLELDASGVAPAEVVSMRLNLGTANGRAVLIRVLQLIGRLPATADLDTDYWTDEGLLIDPNTSWGAQYATSDVGADLLGPGHHVTRVQNSGVALASSLFVNGLIDLKFSRHGISAANLVRVASNKLLRDYVNELDLRQAKFGGHAPDPAYVDDGLGTNDASGYNNYNETQEAPLIMTDANAAGNPWNNGQAGAYAQYGSGFCFACHRGRLGNYVGLVDADRTESLSAARLDGNFAEFEVPVNASSTDTPWVQGPSGIGYMTDADTCYNHPTLMNTPYNGIGTLRASNYPGGGSSADDYGSYGDPGTYEVLTGNYGNNFIGAATATDDKGFGTLNGYPASLARGLALSNQGFVMWPVRTDSSVHPDGRIGDHNYERPKAPICQQCHEDSRDVETGFAYMDTDKDTPYAGTVNGVLGLTPTSGPTMDDLRDSINGETTDTYGTIANNIATSPDPDVDASNAPFLYDGNPAFQNFPHETQNYRLLVEGGDSNRELGGQNDDLCLNCHVPGSTIRPGSDQVIFNTLVKDFNGFQE